MNKETDEIYDIIVSINKRYILNYLALRKNIMKKLPDITFGNNCLALTSKTQAMKENS